MRPNFWPNTPDILAGVLRRGGPAAFRLRAVLAATLGAELGHLRGLRAVREQAGSASRQEYLDSEKYELEHRDWDAADSLAPFVARLNDIRRRHPAFAELRTHPLPRHRQRPAPRALQERRPTDATSCSWW